MYCTDELDTVAIDNYVIFHSVCGRCRHVNNVTECVSHDYSLMKLVPVLHDIGVHSCMHAYYSYVSSFTEKLASYSYIVASYVYIRS